MTIARNGAVAGYVSGGCVEGNLALMGREVASTGRPRLVVFGEGSPFVDIRLVCGARIEIFLEPIRNYDPTLIDVLNAGFQRKPIVRGASLDGDVRILPSAPNRQSAGFDGRYAWRRYDPQPRLILFGADPVALATAQFARGLGMETVLVRPKGPRASPGKFVSHYSTASPAEALSAFPPDRWTAVVSTTHDLDQDHETLERALPSPACYVGALGSRRRLPDRMAKLSRANLPPAATGRLRAPIGLDIGAASAAEIALAILADIIRTLRKR
jgi:xanthine dehydrogenase accessory factor